MYNVPRDTKYVGRADKIKIKFDIIIKLTNTKINGRVFFHLSTQYTSTQHSYNSILVVFTYLSSQIYQKLSLKLNYIPYKTLI